jgi:hypothetical protein
MSDDSAAELAAIRRRFGNRPTMEKESFDSGMKTIADLAHTMPELAAPAPHRPAIEQTDEERAEHAKRVREQAAQIKARVMQNKPAAGQQPPEPCPTEANIA